MNCGAGLGEAIPGIWPYQPGRNAQQRGFAGAIAPDQADPVASRNGQLRAGKQGCDPKGHDNFLQQKQLKLWKVHAASELLMQPGGAGARR